MGAVAALAGPESGWVTFVAWAFIASALFSNSTIVDFNRDCKIKRLDFYLGN